MVKPVAAYGLFYLENRPVLLRAIEVSTPVARAELVAAREAGFNALRPTREGLVSADVAAESGLALLEGGEATAHVAPLAERPFCVSVLAERATASAREDAPAALWGLPADVLAIATAVARGARGYSVSAPPGAWPALAALQRWLAAQEEELTASVAVQDGLACLDTGSSPPLLEGGFGVLALAGYNPPLVDLLAAQDADLAEFRAALFPSNGMLEVNEYGKLVVLTLRGATLVTYPQPVQRTTDGVPYRSTFLWPLPPEPSAGNRRGVRTLGRRVQVRDGVSTLLGEPFGEPYAGPAYYRLPEAQRAAHRDLTLALFGDAVERVLEPDRTLEVELVARLSPDGGALLFVLNRLGAQAGSIRVADPGALRVRTDFTVAALFAGTGSTARRGEYGIDVTIAPRDVLVLRLG